MEKLEKASTGGEVETTGGDFYHSGPEILPVSSQFLSCFVLLNLINYRGKK